MMLVPSYDNYSWPVIAVRLIMIWCQRARIFAVSHVERINSPIDCIVSRDCRVQVNTNECDTYNRQSASAVILVIDCALVPSDVIGDATLFAQRLLMGNSFIVNSK